MQDYHGKVVANTGAANGIGKELALRFAEAGASLALADIDADNLAGLAKQLTDTGATVLTSVFDVRHFEDMEAFARRTFDELGGVDLFFDNAGVISVGTIWEQPLSDWDWLLDVNVKGVLHGIKAFVPEMIAQAKPCRIIVTSSIAGLLTVENSPAYVASKFASLALTEVMDLQLQAVEAQLTAHVVCPAIIQTDLDNCLRHRDPSTYDAADPYYASEDFQRRTAVVTGSIPYGLPVAEAVGTIVDQMEKGTFYILTHPAYNPAITGRTEGIVAGVRPSLVKR